MVLAFATLLPWLATEAFAKDRFPVVYLQREDDPFYDDRRVYTGLALTTRRRPVDGLQLALKDGRIAARALDMEFDLLVREPKDGESASQAIRRIAAEDKASVFVVDLPVEDVAEAGAALKQDPVVLFNIRHPDDALRDKDCSPVLFHTYPSSAMLADALGQFLRKKDWNRVLVLVGEAPADQSLEQSFSRAAAKFGLKIVDRRSFVLSNDPRMRDQINVPLMTGGVTYDVVFVADADGEFARYVPYATLMPRPVVGSAGLVPAGWHVSFERNGAPQLNQRFEKAAGRPMQSSDYAAWAAGKSVIEALQRTRSTDPKALSAFLLSDAFALDSYKGNPGSFRPWDRQLRQPILLHTPDAVIERAPLDGFLHQRNTLDSLGRDEPESGCRLLR
jgi:ABC transporter substrate binding protein (PQQ-dependent alcohol dehydrogenase system)